MEIIFLIEAQFQINLIIKEFIDTGEEIQIYSLADYLEPCRNWKDVKKSLNFFINRIENKINGVDITE